MPSTTQPEPQNPGEIQLQVLERESLVLQGRSYHWISGRVCGILENKQPALWWWIFIPCALVALIGVGGGLLRLVSTGAGISGDSNRVMWGWSIVNFMFWIGIGYAGTLISAILFLTRQHWRTSITRISEAMTFFALICAGIFPALHVGRLWFAWFLAPLPNANGIWQNFKSPLLWDLFAVSTYFIISLVFCYLGLIPDLAAIRDRAKPGLRKIVYAILAIGWRGGNRQWRHYTTAYLLLASLVTVLALSVHSIVSCDIASSVAPGWHSAISPPCFVAGAISGGCAMMLIILVPARSIYRLQDLITMKHIDNMARIILLASTVIGFSHLMDLFAAYYSGAPHEVAAFKFQVVGPYGWAYVVMILCNVLLPQLFWFRTCRENLWIVMCMAMCVNVGMWFERFVIIIGTLTRTWLPGDWKTFSPTLQDQMLFVGTIGLFLSLSLLFFRFLPCIHITGVKQTLNESNPHPNPHDPGVTRIPAYQKELASSK
jgi:molybdopterin-containing oxidoreductase family membrane subunit